MPPKDEKYAFFDTKTTCFAVAKPIGSRATSPIKEKEVPAKALKSLQHGDGQNVF